MPTWIADLLFAAVNFLLLAGGLGWLLFKPVRAAIDKERASHDAAVAEAETARTQAEALRDQARAALSAATAEADRVRTAAAADARGEANRLREAAQRKQADERRAFDVELAARERSQAETAATTLGRIAGDGVRRLLEDVRGPSLDDALVRSACEALGGLPRGGADGGDGRVVVESAHPLSAESKRVLAAAVGRAFDERVVADLGAGVRIITGAGEIDASALSFAREAAHAVTAHARGATAGGSSSVSAPRAGDAGGARAAVRENS